MKISLKKTCDLLKNMDNILIISHYMPDGDTLGSAYGLCYALLSMGKKANVICSDEIHNKYDYFVKAKTITPLEKHDFVVCVDIADKKLIGEKYLNYGENVDLCIDHHISNTLYAKNTLLDPKAAATAEIMYYVIKGLGVKVDKVIADALYTGISTDTAVFRYSNTTYKTLKTGAELVKHGASSHMIAKRMFETKSLERINFERQVINTLESYEDGQIMFITVSKELIDSSKDGQDTYSGISALVKQIEGVKVGFTLKETAKNQYRISVRTSDEVDASVLCKNFGGGGHARAAGCMINEDIDAIKQKLISQARKMLSNKNTNEEII